MLGAAGFLLVFAVKTICASRGLDRIFSLLDHFGASGLPESPASFFIAVPSVFITRSRFFAEIPLFEKITGIFGQKSRFLDVTKIPLFETKKRGRKGPVFH